MKWGSAVVIAAVVLHIVGSLLSAGAVCDDGWRSHSAGRGTCSGHGGVAYWVSDNPNVGAVKGAAWLLTIAAIIGWVRESSETRGSIGFARSDRTNCPRCGSAMIVRTRKDGRRFLGCMAFPSCRGTRGYRSTRSASRRNRLPL